VNTARDSNPIPAPASGALTRDDWTVMTATGELRAAAATGFVLELARALHEYGTPAHRLEVALQNVATRLGLRAEFFTTPTSIMVGFGELSDQKVHLLRVEPSAPNLGHLAQISDIIRCVVDGTITPGEGLRQLHAVKAQPARWPTWLVLLAFVLSSAAVACFLKVRLGDVAIASVLGLVTGVIALTTASSETWRPVTEPVAAFVVTTLALAADVIASTGSGYATSLAGLVVLLPGLTFTVALTELSTRHLASGTARLSGALVVFLGLGFGLALGAKLGTSIGHALQDVAGINAIAGLSRATLPAWGEWLALIVAPLAFTVLLNASARDAAWIVLACAAAYLTSRFAGASMGEELGAFLGAFIVSAGSNLAARLFRRSAMVTQVPGLLILVPGSIGFRSMTSLLGQQVEVGIATAFRVGIVGISLAAGILAGNVVTSALRQRRPTRDVLPSHVP
jgi:uncharacterized membrane protein YjjP (DUF1212 family)